MSMRAIRQARAARQLANGLASRLESAEHEIRSLKAQIASLRAEVERKEPEDRDYSAPHAPPVRPGVSCECCWSSCDQIADSGYSDAMRAHEDRGCECTKPTMAGLRARAGQFWDDALDRDCRYFADEWAALVAQAKDAADVR